MNVNPTDVAKKASPLCGGKVCYPTQPAIVGCLYVLWSRTR